MSTVGTLHEDTSIRAPSALELAVAEKLRPPSTAPKTIAALQSLSGRAPFKTRLAAILLLSAIPIDDVEFLLGVVDTRNRIVHEGYRPTESDAERLRASMKTIAAILGLPELKSPTLYGGNQLSPPPH